MSVLWEKLSGSTDRFAFKVAFLRDPDEGAAASTEMTASWGAFQLWVDGQNLCAHKEEGETLESIHWYLLPLFEWLVENWDPLLHEEKLPLARQAEGGWASLRETQFPPAAFIEDSASEWEARWQAWWGRHCLLACRDGGLFPDVCLRRKRDEVELSWGRSSLPGAPSSFNFTMPSGVFHCDPAQVADSLYEVLSDALKFLLRQVPSSRRLRAADRAIRKIETKSRRERRLAWLAGIGTESTILRGWRRLVERVENGPTGAANSVLAAEGTDRVVTGSCHAALMFGSLSPQVRSEDVITLADKLVGLHSQSGDSQELVDLMEIDLPTGVAERPWEHGYRLADAVLEELGIPGENEQHVNMSAVCKRLGISCETVKLVDANVRAVAVAGPQTHPCILINENFPYHDQPEVVRFIIAHELCHLIFDRTRGKKLALASGPWAPVGVEQRAKAFAAMFLMPPQLVQHVVGGHDLKTLDGLGEVAAKMETSMSATLEHLYNIGLIDEVTRNRMRAKLGHAE